MFRNTDKITLTLLNARDINGYIIPFHLKLPLTTEEITIPKDLVSIEVHEYCEGPTIYDTVPYKICIGSTTTLNKLLPDFNENPIKKAKINHHLEIKSIENTILCYLEIDGIKRIYTTINNQDIVVHNQEELIHLIKILSNEFNNLRNTISNIKKLSLTKTNFIK